MRGTKDGLPHGRFCLLHITVQHGKYAQHKILDRTFRRDKLRGNARKKGGSDRYHDESVDIDGSWVLTGLTRDFVRSFSPCFFKEPLVKFIPASVQGVKEVSQDWQYAEQNTYCDAECFRITFEREDILVRTEILQCEYKGRCDNKELVLVNKVRGWMEQYLPAHWYA